MGEASRIHPKYVEPAKEFQRRFQKYFPHLIKLDLAAFEMDWLRTRVIFNPLETVRPRQAKAELMKAVKALQVLADHDAPYWQYFITLAAEADADPVTKCQRKILKFIFSLDEMKESGLLDAVIAKYVADAESAIDNMPETRNINWEAVHAVDSLRVLWWRNTGKDAPRTLNPASTFANFLRDGFSYLRIEADPVSAFKRWADKLGDDSDERSCWDTQTPPGLGGIA